MSIIGPVLGPIAQLPAASGGTVYVNRDGLYTFAIGGLPFNVAPTDTTPYQRATAQFRKQQFDAAQTPGDQSLDGLWLRGQFSFHRGAGVKFYESLDGAAVESRFLSSEGVDPWTPGEVALPPLLDLADSTNVVDAAVRYDDNTSIWSVYAITSGNAVRRITDAAATTLTSGTATSVAANDQRQTFVTASTKIQRLGTGTTFTDLITNTSGRTFVKVAWAKGRLFFVDTDGRWFAKPNAVANVADTDAFWASGQDSTIGDWSVAESPSAVYLGKGSAIYSVIPDSNGSVPTLSAPVVAATLPPGETVKALGHSLGWLIVVTDAGVRVAQSSSDGNLDMGPVLVQFTSSTCRQVGLWKNLAYVSGKEIGATNEGLYSLDLTQVLDTNVVAWTKRSSFFTTGVGSGACHAAERLVTFGAEGTRIASTSLVETTGQLTTGFIRFGTLEPKAFHSLRVKVDGTEGAVAVSLLRKGGAETLLTSLPATRLGDQDVALNLPAPEEYIGFKFVLTVGAGGTGPTLLGYQLRALPAPAKRSRMVSIPLLCYDSETSAAGNILDGGGGSAYARLAQLEAMEESAGISLFQDFRSGEQAQCFIEEVNFVNRTPPKGAASGFGGIINVTLRKLT